MASCTIGPMAVPGRAEAASVLLALDPPEWFLRHSAGVAEVAAFLAARAAAHGRSLDRRLAEAAGLLHDVDKLLPSGDPARRLSHGRGSAAWLTRQGYAELSRVAAWHPVTRLLHDDANRLAEAGLEAMIVAYADKRVGQRLVPMTRRFSGWRRRFPGSWTSADGRLAEARARRLERDVCAAAGIAPETVRRRRWVRAAMAAARGAR